MVALKDLFSGRVQVTLKSISYEMTDFAEEEATLTCQDSVKHIETGNDYLAALITRKLKFSPKGPFKLMVSYTTKFYLKQEYVGKAAWDEYNLKELSQEDKEFLTADELDRVSLLISQITTSFNRSPIVTPPVLMK